MKTRYTKQKKLRHLTAVERCHIRHGQFLMFLNSIYYRCYVLPSLKYQNRFRFSLKESVAVLQ